MTGCHVYLRSLRLVVVVTTVLSVEGLGGAEQWTRKEMTLYVCRNICETNPVFNMPEVGAFKSSDLTRNQVIVMQVFQGGRHLKSEQRFSEFSDSDL